MFNVYKIMSLLFDNRFLGIFKRNDVNIDKIANDLHDDTGDLADFELKFVIRNKRFIQSRIIWLCDRSHIVTIYMPDDKASFQSVILDVNVNKGYFKIDKQLNRELDRKIKNSINIEFICDIKGVKFSFKTAVIRPVDQVDASAILLKIPLLVLWYQRRATDRIAVPKSHVGSYFECQSTDGSQSIKFVLENVGSHGFLMRTKNAELIKLLKPEMELDGKICLHQLGDVSVRIVIRHTVFSHHHKNDEIILKCGCEILNDSADYLIFIRNYVRKST